MVEYISYLLSSNGVSESIAVLAGYGATIVAMILLSILANFVAKRLLDVYVRKIAEKTPTKLDDKMIEFRVLEALSRIGPALVIYSMAPQLLVYTGLIQNIVACVMIFYITLAIFRMLDAFVAVSRERNREATGPFKGIVEVVKIALAVLAVLIMLVSFLGNEAAWAIFSGIGGLSAVLMLVFRDSILGLVAGVQLSTGGLLKLGDWLEMPQYGADGEVVDITLTKVVVKNWDKTFTTIPAYKFIEDSFKNWEGMTESGGRRIKRAIYIDMGTIGFLSDEQIAELKEIDILKVYLDSKEAAIAEHNEQVTGNHIANRRQLTNIGTFRAYVEAYLRNSTSIHQELTLLVRQLAAGDQGLPLEIYCFTNGTAWASYEGIQADLFDHFLAVMPMFGLMPYQKPGGRDLQRLK